MASKKEFLTQEVSKLVNAGKASTMETVDFNDPHRAKTCLEVDFPILPVNQVAIIEGNAGKPIYQMSKWWARRRSSVFRAMLIAAATKAPEDPSHAAKLVWDNYYANHQKRGAFKHIKVADIFMGGGTTLVEGSRLGMKMFGNDLNPVAWFVVKQEFSGANLTDVKSLLSDVEAEVRPLIMPYYYCDGPNGEKGKWTHLPTQTEMRADFDPLKISIPERKDYIYDGPQSIYTFWGKHGPCQVTGCGHRTPIITSPVIAVKTLSVKSWDHVCSSCNKAFSIEEKAARIAPDVPLYVASTEEPFTILETNGKFICPFCQEIDIKKLEKGKSKKVELSLILDVTWLKGSAKNDDTGQMFGGSVHDDIISTKRWNDQRSHDAKLLEVRGKLPDEVFSEKTNSTIQTGTAGGTVPKRSHFACASCGTVQDLLAAGRALGKAAPTAAYVVQGFSKKLELSGSPYHGRFFAQYDENHAKQYNAAMQEWENRKDTDLAPYWPRSAIPVGAEIGPHDVHGHHFTHWWTMFNPRQMLVLTQLYKSILTTGQHSWDTREYVLGAFQQYLRNQNMFCFWNLGADKMEPHYSRNSFHPKLTAIENSVFGELGRGNWTSCVEGILEGKEWAEKPWELVSLDQLVRTQPELAKQVSGKSEKVFLGDPVLPSVIFQGSSTELSQISDESLDLVITDPPFGDLVQYSELADFFYVWLRLSLKDKYPEFFSGEYTPKTLEAVANRYRESEDPNGFYQRLLTECWKEACRGLKAGGILAFTFHHSEDEPWVAVLESLFDAGFYLEATYPIRSDETKGEGQFGSQKVEFDIIHVCRKRTEEPEAVSWGRMRREVLADVRQIQAMLENHAKEGLPAADLQVIRRGKALEYFSRHYGRVFKADGETISVKEALVGINQILDEENQKAQNPPPVTAEPITRQFLRIFEARGEIERDQMQKYLRGSGVAPDEFVQRGWCKEQNKIFHLINPMIFAQDWHGRHKRRLTSDLDQAFVLVGSCFDGSGINAADTLRNDNFKPHPALKNLLEWLLTCPQ